MQQYLCGRGPRLVRHVLVVYGVLRPLVDVLDVGEHLLLERGNVHLVVVVQVFLSTELTNRSDFFSIPVNFE
jgi:hypothetical protein